MSNRTGDDPFSTFAAELSHNLPLIERLLAEHPPDSPCRGCVLPGPQAAPQGPCGPRSVALLALRIRAERAVAADDPSVMLAARIGEWLQPVPVIADRPPGQPGPPADV